MFDIGRFERTELLPPGVDGLFADLVFAALGVLGFQAQREMAIDTLKEINRRKW